MLKKRLRFLLLSCFGLLCLEGPAWSVGFRPSTPVAVLGQPLDVSVGLTVSPGETLDPDCVRAEVTIGDVLLPREAVGAQIVDSGDGRPAVRVRSFGQVNEPVVAVNVSVGCNSSVSRKFVVFADPPGMVPAPSAGNAPEVHAVVAGSPALRASLESGRSPVSTGAGQADAPQASTGSPKPKPRARPRRERAATQSVGAGSNPTLQAATKKAPTRKRAAKNAAPVQAAPVSRLRLDAAPEALSNSPSIADDALAAVKEANAAVLAAIAAASSSQSRMSTLESQVERLRLDAQEQAAITAQLRERAAQAERRTAWVLPLLGMALLLGGLAVWLWLRLRALESTRQAGWQQAVAAPARDAKTATPPGEVPMLVERSIRSGRSAAAMGGLAPAASVHPSEWFDDSVEPHYDPELANMRTQPLPPSVIVPSATAKGVSAEELIDLEQQAEFFIVLGQEESAIDLLVRHLRETGGASPLPYLKLLDIYRDLNDREAYDRTRDRFNQRFNALAPEWDASRDEGRPLSDYPAVLETLQQSWSVPVDAMAELEALLFRRNEGELFDLPAYRDLLFLYTLARDLAEPRDGKPAGSVIDVLLPLHGARDAPSSTWDAAPDEDRAEAATAPVDLDLSEPSESSFNRLS